MSCIERSTSSMACFFYRETDEFDGVCLVKIDRRVRWRVSCKDRPTSSMACVLYRETDEFDGVCLV